MSGTGFMDMTKEAVRAEIRAALREYLAARDTGGRVVDAAENGAGGVARRIWAAVEAAPEFGAAHTILLYASLPDEVPTGGFLSKWAAQKRLVLPCVDGNKLLLRPYDPTRLQPGYLNILEPSAELPEVAPSEIDLALVPGLAFTADGVRLGRGKGFYDRLLPELSCPKIGICYPCQIRETLPSDDWDARVDKVIF